MFNHQSPYERFRQDKLILRDVLARDRTDLANERTVLAYFRTALMFAASGITLIRFFPDQLAIIAVGYLLTLLSAPIGIFGLWRFWSLRSDIERIGKN